MYNSKLYSALTYFNKYEQNRLRKFINSPYFNKNEAIIHLYEIIIKHINKNKEDIIPKELLWNNIFQDKKFDDTRFRKLKSDLLKLIEGFLAQQVFDENPLHQAAYLIEAVANKRMTELYSTAQQTAIRLSEKQKLKPSNFYYYQYAIEKNLYKFNEYKFNRLERRNVEEIANNLDAFYLAEKLKYYATIQGGKSIVSHEYQYLFIDEIIDHIKKYKYETIPPISIYFQSYLTINQPDIVSHYFNLKELLQKHSSIFPKEEALNLYEIAVNYCIRKANKGQSSYYTELFELYEDILLKEIIFTNKGELKPIHFKNIIAAATRLEKFEWAENFIEQYKDKLPESLRENAVTFNLARLYFFQKKYDDVISLLREVEYDDLTYNLSSKALLVKTFYETDETDILFSIADTFRVFLGRKKKIPVQRRQNYLNLIKFTKKLAKLIPSDKKGLEKIKKEIENTETAIDPWILDKVKELE